MQQRNIKRLNTQISIPSLTTHTSINIPAFTTTNQITINTQPTLPSPFTTHQLQYTPPQPHTQSPIHTLYHSTTCNHYTPPHMRTPPATAPRVMASQHTIWQGRLSEVMERASSFALAKENLLPSLGFVLSSGHDMKVYIYMFFYISQGSTRKSCVVE